MPEKKRKPKIQASDVEVGNRTLEAVLLDLAERSNTALEEIAALKRETSEQNRLALAEITVLRRETSAALEQNRLALDHLSALTRDHIGLAVRTGRIETRLDALEKAS